MAQLPHFLHAPVALFDGLRLLANHEELRKWAYRPWLIGLVTYIIALALIYPLSGELVGLAGIEYQPGWKAIFYYLAALVSVLVMFFGGALLSFLAVIILGGYYQGELALSSLRICGYPVPELPDTLSHTAREVVRITGGEIGKACILLPAYLCLFVIGLIPIFTPFAFIAASWLFAFQWFDYSLDARRDGLLSRLFYGVRHPLIYVAFGAPLLLLASIPFAGILLAPAFVVSAASLFTKIERS